MTTEDGIPLGIGFKEVIVSAVITRADGTIEDKGILTQRRNPVADIFNKIWYRKR